MLGLPVIVPSAGSLRRKRPFEVEYIAARASVRDCVNAGIAVQTCVRVAKNPGRRGHHEIQVNDCI